MRRNWRAWLAGLLAIAVAIVAASAFSAAGSMPDDWRWQLVLATFQGGITVGAVALAAVLALDHDRRSRRNEQREESVAAIVQTVHRLSKELGHVDWLRLRRDLPAEISTCEEFLKAGMAEVLAIDPVVLHRSGDSVRDAVVDVEIAFITWRTELAHGRSVDSSGRERELADDLMKGMMELRVWLEKLAGWMLKTSEGLDVPRPDPLYSRTVFVPLEGPDDVSQGDSSP